MKVIQWWKFLVMKVILWWKLASDENKLVMKVEIVKEVKRSDGLWRFACGDVFVYFRWNVRVAVKPFSWQCLPSCIPSLIPYTNTQNLIFGWASIWRRALCYWLTCSLINSKLIICLITKDTKISRSDNKDVLICG